MTKYFVTTSLPYANGPLHLGHLLEHIQADIWVRFLREQGHTCVFVSGDDAHGSAIMLAAEKKAMEPEAYVDSIYRSHKSDLEAADISFDCYHSTRSTENIQLVKDLYTKLEANGCFVEKTITQAYDESRSMFLPDRYIKGRCPKCGAADQYGDHCEVCGATYAPADLLDAYSVLSASKPSQRDSQHIFFKLSGCETWLKTWLEKAQLQAPVKNKLGEWLTKGLIDWDITRDSPYFGIQIPGRKHQYFYVWMDAPVGYMAALQAFEKSSGQQDLGVWTLSSDNDWQIVHFIGKDIVNFHGVFWPAVLKSAGYRQPDNLHVHGFLTINGEKMSKSRGTFVQAREYLEDFSSEYLRYYFAAKLNDQVSDIDLNWEDFSNRCNADLVGKLVNIASRSSGFVHKFFDGQLQPVSETESELLCSVIEAKSLIVSLYQRKAFQSVVREVMTCADQVNQYIDHHKPWLMAKEESNREHLWEVVSTALHAFKCLMTYLSPVLPKTAQATADFFNQATLDWAVAESKATRINIFPRMLERIDLVSWNHARSQKT